MSTATIALVEPVTPTVADLRRIRIVADRMPLTETEVQCVLALTYVPGRVLADGTWTAQDVAQARWARNHPGSASVMLELAWEAVAQISGQRDSVSSDELALHWDAM